MTQEMIQELENDIQEAKRMVELGNCLERLTHNRDFKQVVMEGYFEKEAVRLVHLKAHPHMQEPAKQENIIKQIDAIGNFTEFLRTLEQMAKLAQKRVADAEEQRDELLMGDSE